MNLRRRCPVSVFGPSLATASVRYQTTGGRNYFVIAGAIFVVLGTANHGYLQNSDVVRQETKSALETALNRDGVQIAFLWLDPELETAKQREQEEARRTLRSDTCDAIKFFWELRKGLSPDKAERLQLRVYKALPTCGITWADDDIIVTHYLTGELNLTAPGLILQATRVV